MPKLTKRRPTLKRTSRTNLEVCKSLLKGKKPDGLSPELFHALLDHGGLQLLPTGQAVPQPPPKMAPTANVFCATGPGGGVDPTCSPGELGAGRRRKIDPNQKEIFPPDWDKPKPEEHIPPPQDDEIKLKQPVHDHAKIENLCKELAGLWGYKGNLKVDNGEPPTFEVNGVKYTEGGHCKLASKEIVVWSRQYREEGGDRRAHTVMTHELMHGTYETVTEKYSAQLKALMDRPDAFRERKEGEWKEGIFTISGDIHEPYLKAHPEIRKEYATYFRLRQFMDNYQMFKELEKHDGVTDYSRNYWAEYQQGKRSSHIAIHETLAEIAAGRMGAVKPKGWKEPSPVWERYYRTVQDEYQVVVGNRKERKLTHKYDVVINRAIDFEAARPVFLDDNFAPTTEENATWLKVWMDGRAVYAQRTALITNAFCATGEGGGIDPTCSSGGSPVHDSLRIAAPKTEREARIIGTALRKAVDKSCGGTEGMCVSVAVAATRIIEGAEPWSGNYQGARGAGPHTIIKAGDWFIDATADQFGGPRLRVMKELTPQYQLFTPAPHSERLISSKEEASVVSRIARRSYKQAVAWKVITNRADLSHVQPMFLDDDFAPTSEEQATWVKLWVDGRAVYAQRMVLTANTFCPTGEGGGIDPTCSPKASGEPRVILDSANKFLSEFSGPSGEKYSVEAEKYEGKWSVSFLLDRGPDDKTMKLTGSAGAAAVGIMRAVGRAIDKFVELKRPEEFYFDAVKNEPSRVRMYATASQSIAKRHGYELTTEDKPDFVVYRFRKQGPANNSRLTANWQVLPNSYLTTHGIMSWFKSCPRDEEGRCGEGGGGSKEPGSDTSGAYMAGVDRQFKNPQESETLKAIVKGEPPHDKHDLHYGLASSKEDTALTAIMKEAGRADVPRSASKEEIDGLVKQGWTECYRGLGNKEYAEQFKKSPDMYNGAGSFGNGSYFTYSGSARGSDKAKKGAEMYAAINDPKGEGGSVVRMAFPKDAKIIDHKDLMKEKDKAVAELFDRHSKGEITKEERDKTREVYEDLGRFGALRNYDGIKERENGFLVVLNRSKCVVQRD